MTSTDLSYSRVSRGKTRHTADINDSGKRQMRKHSDSARIDGIQILRSTVLNAISRSNSSAHLVTPSTASPVPRGTAMITSLMQTPLGGTGLFLAWM